MSITITPGVSQTLTFNIPRPNSYLVSSARLYVTNPRGQSVRTVSPSFSTPSTVSFELLLTKKQLTFFFDYGNCEFKEGKYAVVLEQGAVPLEPPTKRIASGPVSVSGPPFGGDCGGEDPPPDDPPPGGGSGGDNPYGPVDPGDALPSLPQPPDEVCLPPSFVAPAPTVPTPCG